MGWFKSEVIILAAMAAMAAMALILPAAASAEPLKVVMLGDSLTAGCDWAGHMPKYRVVNMGVGGNTTAQMLARFGRVIEEQPDVVFLQGGINDISLKFSLEVILDNHLEIWRLAAENLPKSRLYVVSLLPVSEDKFPGWNRKVRQINRKLEAEARGRGLPFIDLFPLMLDDDKQLRDDYHWDGVHLRPEGYAPWLAAVEEALKGEAR